MRPQNPATGGKPHRITAKCGHRRGVREGLRLGGKNGVLSRICVIWLRDPAVLLGKRGGAGTLWQEIGRKLQKTATAYPAQGVVGCPRRRNRQKPVYRPIQPASRPQNPATGDKPHRITAKAPF
jgi:hypothetical protein